MRRPRALRTQLAITIAVIVSLLTVSMGILSYFTARHFLVVDQQRTLERQAIQQAFIITRELNLGTTPSVALSHIDLANDQTAGLYFQHTWYRLGQLQLSEAFSPGLRSLVRQGQDAVETTALRGVAHFAVGISLGQHRASYLLNTSLQTLQHTLDVLLEVLLSAALVIVSLGAFAGAFAARRSMLPLKQVSQAASAIAGGDLAARLPERPGDPDLGGLGIAFNDMAERLTERIERDSRFASDVSHELRSPLTSMASALDVIERNAKESDQRTKDAIALFAGEVHRFERLLQDLIELARLESNTSLLAVEEVEVGELIRHTMQNFEKSHNTGRLPTLEITVEAAHSLMSVDKRRFERILGNLMDNAVQYGGGIEAIDIYREGGDLYINVQDRGPGISEEDLPHVFERFYRGAEAGRRRSGDGSGLGLAIVATQVSQLHGAITLQNNQPEPGLSAQLRLPLLREEDNAI